MWGSKQAILGANNNIKGAEQFRLFLVDNKLDILTW